MKVAVIGSRGFTDRKKLFAELNKLPDIELIVSGGARGADKLAEAYASEKGIPIKVFKPDWGKYGNAAGIIRNEQIVKEAEMVVAFWDSKSKGTKSSIDLARKFARKLSIVFFEEKEVAQDR
jgi:hypothetical protein